MAERYVSVKEIAEKWGITVRRVQMMCTGGLIPGAKKVGKLWMLPENAVRPPDRRTLPIEQRQSIKGPQRLAKAAAEGGRNNIRFISMMSHQIRTSLNAIMGYSDLIRDHREEEEKTGEYVDNIQNSCKSILDLLNNTMEFSRLQNGKVEVSEEICNVENFIQNIIDNEDAEARRRHIRIVKKIRLHHEFIQADVEKLERIFGNILNNAVKYSHDDGTVQFRVEEQESHDSSLCRIRYIIEDQGAGMSEGFLEHIFDSFTTENMSGREWTESGSGLGMAIAGMLTELLHGSIDIESNLNFGTRVTLSFSHAVADISESLSEGGRSDDYSYLRGKRLLLAEDNALNREIAKTVLEEAGMQVSCAEDGILCVALLERNTFDLILMDLLMPNMDGFTAAKIIRRLDEDEKAAIPIIAMTASVREEDREKALMAGMNGFVEKPIDRDHLLKIISQALN